MDHIKVVVFEKNDNNRVRVVCKVVGCKWSVFASMLGSDGKTFKVKSLLEEHTCVVLRNSFVNSKMILKKYV